VGARDERRASGRAGAGAAPVLADVVAEERQRDAGHDQVGTVVDRGQQQRQTAPGTRRAGEVRDHQSAASPTGPEGLAAPSPFFEPVHHAFRIGVVLVDEGGERPVVGDAEPAEQFEEALAAPDLAK